ncbi:alpha/beta hydrolase family protein [Hymenobacter crusticola]|uniref:Alpha/beta hydrolase n=1 Tax=Hymenobacter crusticola TaxID=1770526 RepID=A0A243W609_9BACT|nr:alpha/beta fold hydrolase [Hymenobacter crusticola]OUJ69199.1 alpha/beta hydrolase [Hymenobacter crusticola]
MHPLKSLFLLLVVLVLFNSCRLLPGNTTGGANTSSFQVKRDTVTLLDQTRNRKVPVALYTPQAGGTHRPVVLVSHGYSFNRPGSYLHYAYLAETLASKGYWVVSIQHELPTDSLLPTTGTPQVVRRPFWERGADNIEFVLHYLQQTRPALDFNQVTLLGHSNGGDMVALFPQKYPHQVAKIITLDNRRMALPRTKKDPQVYSLRSSDQVADAGVLPTPEEQKRLGMTIIALPRTIHNDMDDHATAAQRQEINEHLLRFLQK